jgi:hypothetical protein
MWICLETSQEFPLCLDSCFQNKIRRIPRAFRPESLTCVDAPTENATQIAELQGGSELQTPVTLDTVPSLVAKSASHECSASPSADLNAGMVAHKPVARSKVSSRRDRPEA